MSAENLFSSKKGLAIYESSISTIDEYSMAECLKGGVVVGFSGGADSVMLLLLLAKYRSDFGHFPILALHINHMIRGEEADRDEKFSFDFCKKCGIDFRSVKADIPALAKIAHTGIEETARTFRYNTFKQIASELNYSAIAVAHNATDNLETIILNMMRGAGTVGLAGIIPKRDNIIRPLIGVSKAEITECLIEANVDFVTDSTNLSTEYTRNYVRSEILPKLSHLSPTPEKMGIRISRNLRDDNELIDCFIDNFFDDNFIEEKIEKAEILKLNKAAFFRILAEMMKRHKSKESSCDSFKSPERTHVDAIYDKLSGENFEYHLPGDLIFVSEFGKCFVCSKKIKAETSKIKETSIELGVTKISGFSSVILTSTDSKFENYLNIYKISIQAQIPFDTINGDLYLREKRDGDAYSYGGMTHKLKKLFNDRKIPHSDRLRIPIICDNDGVLWVPGFNVRESQKSVGNKFLYIAIATPIEDCEEKDKSTFYFSKRN